MDELRWGLCIRQKSKRLKRQDYSLWYGARGAKEIIKWRSAKNMAFAYDVKGIIEEHEKIASTVDGPVFIADLLAGRRQVKFLTLKEFKNGER